MNDKNKTKAQLVSELAALRRRELAGRTWAEAELRKARDELETRVRERTAELVRANEALQAEIAERRRADAALRESEERYRSLIETSPDAITLTDLEGRVLVCNRQAALLYGCENAEEMIGTSAFEFVAPEDRQRAIDNARKTLETGSARNVEYTLLKKDGSRYSVELNASLIVDAEGKPSAFIGVTRDITERKRAEEALRAQKQLLENLVAVARATAEQPTLEAILQNALDVTTALTGAEYGDLFLLNTSGAVTYYILPPRLAASGRHREIVAAVMEKGLAGWVARHSQAALIADTTQDERWLVLPDDLYDVRSALCVPIMSGAALIGVLTLTHSQPGCFTARHLQLLQAAADQMALAVRNAQIFDALRRMADRQITLYEVLRTVSEQLDPDAIARLAAKAVTEFAGWPHVSVAMPDAAGTHWTIRAASGGLSNILGMTGSITQGVTGRAFRTVQTQLVPDVSADPDYVMGHPDIRSELAVPLRRGERVLGVLNLESDRPAAFDADDVLLAESLAEAIALALDNARLYKAAQHELTERKRAEEEIRRLNQSLERRARALTALNKAGQAIASTLDPDSVLQLVIAEVKGLLEAEGASVLLHDPDNDELVFAAALGPAAERLVGMRFPAAAGIAGAVLREKQPALVSDARNDSRFYNRIDATTGLTTRSLLAVPLIFKGTATGVLEAINKASGTFDPHDLETLETMAGSAAIAIEHARLYQATLDERSRLQALISSSRDGVILTGMRGDLQVINAPALRLLSLPGQPEDWIGRSLSDALRMLRRSAPAIVKAALLEMRRSVNGDEPPGEGECEAPPRTMQWLNLPVLSGGTPQGRLLVLHDVTSERAVERLREDMTRMMVHDLRNPIGTILTAQQLLSTEAADVLSADQRRMLEIADSGAKRLLGLVNSILDVSQLESGQVPLSRVSVPLGDLVAETLRSCLPVATAKSLHLESDALPGLPPAWADAELVGRVLQNLVGNACKFTPAGGTVRVTTRVETRGGYPVLLVSVSDTGPGIPAEIQSPLFQKFVRGHQAGRGSGLGLAFCKLAVEAHGEHIWVESTSGRGTTFTFSLPTASSNGSA